MEQPKVRKPAVAGQFYPGTAQALRKEIESFALKQVKSLDVIACMLPHAGYMYSGKVAAQTVSAVNIKEKVVLFGPNHTGYGTPYSIMAEGAWQTPLGEVKIDSILAKKILAGSKYLESDEEAHLYEHSLEVELPILQYFKKDFKIVPITIMSQEANVLKEVGENIAEVIQNLKLEGSVMLVASSDMTHYEPKITAAKKDKEAIEAILKLDEDGLIKKIRQLNISMCGWAPVVLMLAAAKRLGAAQAELVKYQTSGDVTGDTASVVGYAGIIVY